jgi:hydroxymethylpyrimidine/phosphomethylpyrimidine kinase
MEAKVIKIIDTHKIAINKGSIHGITKNDTFMIFKKGEELFDPDTKESLGYLEIPKLKMKVFNIQEKISLLESNETVIETDRKIKRTIKKYKDRRSELINSTLCKAYGLGKNDEEETIIEEEPKERLITVQEKDIREGNIARKI